MPNKKSSGKQDKQNKLSTNEENDYLKAKLNAEYGSQFSESSSELPEDVENQWLKNMEAFEKAHENPQYRKVYDIIGRPDFKKAATLTKKEISSELERILQLLDDHNIVIDFIADYEDKVKYRFITEELFEKEMTVVDVPGMYSCYIYEEFHPNPLLDAKDAINEIINGINKKSKAHFATWRFHENGIIDSKGHWIDSKEIDNRYTLLQNSIEVIEIDHLGEGAIELESENKAVYTNQIHYRYKMDGAPTWTEIKDTLRLELQPSEYASMWSITKMEFPGIKL